MNKLFLAGVAAALVAVGLIFGSVVPGITPSSVEAQSTGKTKHVTLIADEIEVQIAPDNALHPGGIMYNAMVFNGTIPGPVISVDQGDILNVTLVNEGDVIHSIDFHAALGPSQVLSGNVKPGESKTWTLEAKHAGAFLYHCGADGLNGVWEHIANGMAGGVVVHPPNEAPAKEFYLVFNEIYNSADQGVFVGANETGTFDIAKFLTGNPDLILTNGMSHKYVPAIGEEAKITLNEDAEVFKVKPGELTRWYVINPGPNDGLAFHFISGMIDVRDGSIKNRYGTQIKNDETWWIPPGSGSVIESVFPEEGIYVGVDHAMNDVVKGGALAVLATEDATDDDHPEGTFVPPKGSEMVSGPSAFSSGANMTSTNTTTDQGAANQTEAEPTDGNTTETGNATMAVEVTGNNSTANATGTATPTDKISIAKGSSAPTAKEFYTPTIAEVSAGTTVTWTNNDNTLHTVVSGTADAKTDLFESPIIPAQGTFEFTFDTPGTYDYFCSLHPFMTAQVQVK